MSNDHRVPNRFWGEKAVPKTKAEFFNAVTSPAPSGTGSVATIRLYGPIDSWGGFWGISTKDVGNVLDALPDTVDQIILRLNSPGGEVFEGVSILNMLRAHKANVTAVIDGLAASAASVIAAGCSDTVMSPGTQMMIHSPWTFAIGDAVDLRKTAEMLDGIEASLIEIYTAKAGEKDWAQLLADETWLTAAESVELGLANRIAIVPDAGETETVGEDDVLVLPTDDDDVVDIVARFPLRTAAAARASKLPSSTEPGDPNQKEDVVAYDDLKTGLRERLGVTDAEASDETLLTAFDQAIEQATAPTPPVAAAAPEGTTLIDSEVLANLQADAAQGRTAREEQNRSRREGIVAKALQEGRIAPAARDAWLAQLEANEEGTTILINSLAAGTVPVAEIGHSDDISAEDSLYASAWGDEKEEN